MHAPTCCISPEGNFVYHVHFWSISWDFDVNRCCALIYAGGIGGSEKCARMKMMLNKNPEFLLFLSVCFTNFSE